MDPRDAEIRRRLDKLKEGRKTEVTDEMIRERLNALRMDTDNNLSSSLNCPLPPLSVPQKSHKSESKMIFEKAMEECEIDRKVKPVVISSDDSDASTSSDDMSITSFCQLCIGDVKYKCEACKDKYYCSKECFKLIHTRDNLFVNDAHTLQLISQRTKRK